jgi:hypothetical protein
MADLTENTGILFKDVLNRAFLFLGCYGGPHSEHPGCLDKKNCPSALRVTPLASFDVKLVKRSCETSGTLHSATADGGLHSHRAEMTSHSLEVTSRWVSPTFELTVMEKTESHCSCREPKEATPHPSRVLDT